MASPHDIHNVSSLGRLVRFGLFEFNLETGELWVQIGHVPIDIGEKRSKILRQFVIQRGQLVTREQLQKNLWPDETRFAVSDKDVLTSLGKRLDTHVSALRAVMKDDDRKPFYIETVPGKGYRFIAPIENVETVILGKPLPGQDQTVMPAEASLDKTTTLQVKARPTGLLQMRQVSKPFLLGTIVGSITAGLIFMVWILYANDHAKLAAQQPLAVENNRPSRTTPVITRVSAIRASKSQRIVIEGHDLGHYTSFHDLDTPFLAIADDTNHWAAGRITPENSDEVTLTVSTWTDTDIIIEGFSGSYGQQGWSLNTGDKLRVRIWNPQTAIGPAECFVIVSSFDTICAK